MERKTPQRKVLKEIFQHSKRPLSVQEALEEAKKVLPSLGLATAYRVINEMVDNGFLKAITLPGDSQHFEVTTLEHHHHFQCNACEKVYDIAGCPGNIAKLVPPGFQLESHEVILFGKCTACLNH